MQIDQLQIELRPRSHAQALDLGFALLRSHAGATYKAFLALWLPLVALAIALTFFLPKLVDLWMVLLWWSRPLLERAPLYVLSRQVFGTSVTWQQALGAWPRQLGGGSWRLLLWGRIIISSGRALLQPIWQLELARGSVASMRQRVISANGTAQAAFWFGVVCVLLEVVLGLGVGALIAMFTSDGEMNNPFTFLFGDDAYGFERVLDDIKLLIAYGIGAAIMGPIYTACGFTLYLNRRASLEAWDLEIALRQIRRPPAARSRPIAAQTLPLLLAACLLALSFGAVPDTAAATPPPTAAVPAPTPAVADKCEAAKSDQPKRSAPADAQQARVRKLVDQVYSDKDLRGYECIRHWVPKPDKDKTKAPDPASLPDLNFIASAFKVTVIALTVGLVGYLLYRYRDSFPAWRRAPAPIRATEVAGLDIRAESLPPDVSAQVRALWSQGARRAALALLYRATLSRLVSENGLHLHQGDTEGDCLRAASEAVLGTTLPQARLDVARTATTMWLNGAYGDRWPDSASVDASCAQWDAQFGAAREPRA